jgi:hypothetical protein
MATGTSLGLPYQGSKRRIAARIVDLFPAAPVLVDVFAGGCAVTHAALLSGKFDKVIANDLSDAPQLFYYCAKYGMPEKPRWVSREDFFALKDRDPLIRYLYSFGNAGMHYMYGLGIEPLKYAAHRAVVDGDCSSLPSDIRESMRIALNSTSGIRERYLCYKRMLRELGKRFDLQHLERLERLQHLEHLEHLEHLDRLIVSRRDYRGLHIPDEAVLYCDPPYASTTGYGAAFDHRAFYAWCRSVGKRFPLFVSEYWMPSDFRCVAEFNVRALAGASTKAQTRVEKIFTI